MNTADLTRAVKEKGFSLGFCKVGVARADSLAEEGHRLREWLARGYHGTMEWMARNFDRRVDPRAIMPSARSVVVVAMNYYADVSRTDKPGIGKVSRYAWGDDYHDLVKVRLIRLKDFIRSALPSATAKVYVDTGPILEKAWAVRAGVGWLGKHTNILTRDYGSWIFIGELLLDCELEYDEPIADYCGTCTLCIEACPTDAIVEPYVLDSNLCISYLTIEYRGAEIPEGLADRFDQWVYGCDICQDVCPWNVRFAQKTKEPGFFPRQMNVAPSLEELAAMKTDEYAERYQASAMKRAKCEGIVRNAKAVARKSEGDRGERARKGQGVVQPKKIDVSS